MKALTKTTESIYAWEAFDGKIFNDRDECAKYENSAKAVAKRAANELIVRETPLYKFFEWVGSEDTVRVYRIKDATDLQIVNTYLMLLDRGAKSIPVEAIGKDYAVVIWDCDEGYSEMGTKEELVAKMLNNIEKAFTPVTTEQEGK